MIIGSTVLMVSLAIGQGGSPATQTAAVVSAQPVTNLARVTVSPLDLTPLPQTRDSWQTQMNEAEGRKARSKKLMIFGGVAAVGGTILGVAAVNSCVDSVFSGATTTCGGQSALSTMGWLVSLGGDVGFIWGLVEFIGANGDISRLSAQRPGGTEAVSISLSTNQDVALRVGRGANVSYRVRW